MDSVVAGRREYLNAHTLVLVFIFVLFVTRELKGNSRHKIDVAGLVSP